MGWWVAKAERGTRNESQLRFCFRHSVIDEWHYSCFGTDSDIGGMNSKFYACKENLSKAKKQDRRK